LIDLDKLNKLRTELFHAEGLTSQREATQQEAEELFAFLKAFCEFFELDQDSKSQSPFQQFPKPASANEKTSVIIDIKTCCVNQDKGCLWFLLTAIFAYLIPVFIDSFVSLTTNHSQQLSHLESELLIFMMAITCAIVIDRIFERFFEQKSSITLFDEGILYFGIPVFIVLICVLIYLVGYFRVNSILVITFMAICELFILFIVMCYVVRVKQEWFGKNAVTG
jgi:hypothetical protein